MRLADLTALADLTLRNPPAAMAALRGLRLTMADRWGLLALAVSLSALLAGLLALAVPAEAADARLVALMRHPLTVASLQVAGMTIAAWLMAAVGRLFRGDGTFADALLVLAWIDLILLAAQLVQLAAVFVLPPLADLVGLATLGLYAYLVIRMTAALHGFRHLPLVALGIVATMIVTGFVLAVILAILGHGQPMEVLP